MNYFEASVLLLLIVSTVFLYKIWKCPRQNIIQGSIFHGLDVGVMIADETKLKKYAKKKKAKR